MTVLGLDIGGATLKAATNAGQAKSVKFALWRQPELLTRELAALLRQFEFDAIAATMTGELCDCFETRREGVAHILASLRLALNDVASKAAETEIFIWTTTGAFVDLQAAQSTHNAAVQAANWHALATLAARWTDGETALLIDIGSTTTDIVPIVEGRPRSTGKTDAQRLASGELVYIGVERTPLCALLSRVTLRGRRHRTMAEWFATTLDAFVVTGDIPEDSDFRDTADGRPATKMACVNRLARTIGLDRESFFTVDAEVMANIVRARIVAELDAAINQVLDESRLGTPQIVVSSGQGEFLVKQLVAAHPSLRSCRFVSMADRVAPAVSRAACAFAVAELLATEQAVQRTILSPDRR